MARAVLQLTKETVNLGAWPHGAPNPFPAETRSWPSPISGAVVRCWPGTSVPLTHSAPQLPSGDTLGKTQTFDYTFSRKACSISSLDILYRFSAVLEFGQGSPWKRMRAECEPQSHFWTEQLHFSSYTLFIKGVLLQTFVDHISSFIPHFTEN